MKTALTILTFFCFVLIIAAIKDCERSMPNKYCNNPKLVWTEHHDGICYKCRCEKKMECCTPVDCEGLVSRSYSDSEDIPDEPIDDEDDEF